MRPLGQGAVPLNLYPWRWAKDDTPSFRALQRSGGNPAGIFVAPILQQLILNRDPDAVLDWVGRVCRWRFRRIIPCHLANDIRAGPADLRRAFAFLEAPPAAVGAREEDLLLLRTASRLLTDLGVVEPEAPKVPRKGGLLRL